MMLTDEKSDELWTKLMKNVEKQEDPVPIIFYYPFKMSKFYLKNLMKDAKCKLDNELFIDYIDKFWHAEQSYDTTRLSE